MNTKVVTISVVGMGGRASTYLKGFASQFPGQFKVVAIADPNKDRQKIYSEMYQVKKENVFDDYKQFFKHPKMSDIVIIGTLDDMHYEPTIAALDLGYDIILEKPISICLEETIKIGEHAKRYPNQMVAVCHVLRHTPFFRKIKEILDSKILGEIVSIQHNENVGYFHYAHSYVRGSWRNTDISAPFIVAKSCHDLDIILYLLKDKKSKRIASFGSNSYFNSKNFDPNTMANRCVDCPSEKQCPYSALKIYTSRKMSSMMFDGNAIEALKNELSTSNFGRCVFNLDNNVADHQVTIIEFEDGITANFSLSAFSNEIHRSLKVMCQLGELRAIEKPYIIEYRLFGESEWRKIVLNTPTTGHGGGDDGFVKNFMNSYINKIHFDSTLDQSIESHVLAFAAEESRLNDGKMIDIEKFWESKK